METLSKAEAVDLVCQRCDGDPDLAEAVRVIFDDWTARCERLADNVSEFIELARLAAGMSPTRG